MLRYWFLIFLLFFFYPFPKAQTINEPADDAITVGNKIPDVIIDQVMHYNGQLKLPNSQSKLTIIDFWNSGCSSCINYFPHMQQLQDKFGDQLQIILVNGKTELYKDNEEKTKKILERLKRISEVDVTLPIVFNSKQLDDYFPYATVPHEVWINDKGVVIAITNAQQVTEENIRLLLEDKPVSFRMKTDIKMDLSTQTLQKLVYDSNRKLDKTPLYASVLLKGMIDGIGGLSGTRRNENEDYTGLFFANRRLQDLYGFAYNITLPDNQIVWEGDSISNLITRGEDDYDQRYSYDLTVSATSDNDLRRHLSTDLERVFRLQVNKTQRALPCIIIKPGTKKIKSMYTKGGSSEFAVEKVNRKKYLRNYPLSALLGEANRFTTMPLIDETGLTQNVDLNFPDDFNFRNEESLIKGLKAAGLSVQIEKRDMDVVVISDK